MRKKIRLSELVYFLLGLYMAVAVLFGSSRLNNLVENADQIIGIVEIIFCIFIVYKFWHRKHFTLTELIRILLVGFILGATAILSGNGTLFTPFIFSVVAYDLDYKKVEKTVLIVLSITIPLIICLALIGIVPNNPVYTTYGGVYRMRYGMGFGHPNAFSAQVIQYMLVWVAYRWEKLKRDDYIFLIVISGVCYYFSRTQTLIVITMLLVFLVVLYKSNKIKAPLLKKRLPLFVIFICSISMFLCMVFYSNSSIAFWRLNAFFTGRLALMHSFYNAYGVSFIARKIELSSWSADGPLKYAILDNAYAQLFIIYGLLAALVFIMAYYCLIKKANSIKNDAIVIVVMVLFIYGIMETYIFRLPYNFTMILAYSALIYDTKIGKRNE